MQRSQMTKASFTWAMAYAPCVLKEVTCVLGCYAVLEIIYFMDFVH